MDDLISVIVPVYNTAKYLGKCIESILAQTFTDFELILIDDGSKDGSGKICDKYSKIDHRVRVIHKNNGGVSSARNAGLEIARGKWITFIDSDDFINPTFLEGLYKPIYADPKIEFVHGGICNWKNNKVIGYNQKYDEYIGENPVTLFNNSRGLACSKLFSSYSVNYKWGGGNPLRFDTSMRIAEDMAFTMDYISTVSHYAFVSECGYMYRIDNIQSLTKKSYRPKYFQEKAQYIHFYNSIEHYIDLHALTEEESRKRQRQCSQVFLSLIHSLYYGECSRKVRIESLKSWSIEHYKQLMSQLPVAKRYGTLLKGDFAKFDFIEYLMRFPYRIRYTILGSVILNFKRYFKK